MQTMPAIQDVRVLYRRHPFSAEVVEAATPAGKTVREIIGDAGEGFFVALDDRSVPVERWATTKPAPGSTLQLVGAPGDDSTKKLLLVAGTIAAAIFAGPVGGKIAGHFTAAATDAGLLGAGLLGSKAFWAASIMAGSSLAMTALVSPPVLEDAE